MDSKIKKDWWETGVQLFAQVSGWIVFPIIAAVYLGRWIDSKYQTEPWLFLVCVGTAFIITTIGIVKVSIKAMNKIAAEGKNKIVEKNKIASNKKI